MRCPYCGYENDLDVEVCESCFKFMLPPDKTDFDSELADAISSDTLAVLNPMSPITIDPTATVAEAIRLLATHNIGCVLVTSAGKLIGIFSERDALRRIGNKYYELAQEPIRRFMTPSPEALGMSDSIAFALNRMDDRGFRHIPIERDGEVVGVVSVRDCLAYVTQHFPELEESTN